MSAIAPPRFRGGRIRAVARPSSSEPRSAPTVAPQANPHYRGGVVLFALPFRSAMRDSDLAVLAHVLDLSTHMQPKMRPDPDSPGVARLDHFSGVFLERGAGEEEWILEGRTWGNPAPESVHEWHLLAAQAVRRLDPRVSLPEPMSHAAVETPGRRVGRAANRRLAHLRRRLVGLP